MYVSIIGGDVGSCSDEDCAKAEELGEKLAENHHILVCGGRGGVMRAACKGAKKANGTTIGILPSADREEANDYVDIPIVTDLGMLRNSLVVLNGDVVVAIDGSYGTLSEICMAKKFGKKIFGLDTWDVDAVDPFEDMDELVDELEKVPL